MQCNVLVILPLRVDNIYHRPVTQQTPAQSWLGTRNSRWQDTAIKRPNPPPVKRERVMKCNVCNGARLQILKQKQAIIHWPMRAAG